jgi:uncharacterized protein YdaU (DUF1376 family)
MTKKADIWMPLYIGDYLSDTAHLSAEESGAYLHLLMHSWKTGALPSNLEILRRIAKVETDAWSNAWSTLQAFFKQCPDGSWMQDRLEKERLSWQTKKEKSSEKAAKAAKARWPDATSNATSIPSSTPQAMLETCPLPLPLPKKIYTPSSADIDSIYLAYPRRDAPGAAKKAIAKSLKLIHARGEDNPTMFLLGKVNSFADKVRREGTEQNFIKMPQGWFNDARYDSEDLQPRLELQNGRESDASRMIRLQQEALQQVERERNAIN